MTKTAGVTVTPTAYFSLFLSYRIAQPQMSPIEQMQCIYTQRMLGVRKHTCK